MCAKATMEEFEALLKESFEIDTPDEGSVVKGKVIAIEAGQAIIDVGYKMEGRVDLKEFANPGEQPDIAVGDEVVAAVEAGLSLAGPGRVRCGRRWSRSAWGVSWNDERPEVFPGVVASFGAGCATGRFAATVARWCGLRWSGGRVVLLQP